MLRTSAALQTMPGQNTSVPILQVITQVESYHVYSPDGQLVFQGKNLQLASAIMIFFAFHGERCRIESSSYTRVVSIGGAA